MSDVAGACPPGNRDASPTFDVLLDKGECMFTIPTRIKVLGATGVLCVGLGAAALNGAFAAPAADTSAATLAAATATPTATASAGKNARPAVGLRGVGSLTQIASYLGISVTDLRTALANEQTLAQVAQAHGKSAADLKDYLVSQLKSRLDQQVSAGRLTSQQETNLLNRASSRFDALINANLSNLGKGEPGFRPAGRWGRGPVFSAAAQALGMNVNDLWTQLQNGKTLAQLAQEHGKTTADVENAIMNALKPQLDKLMTTNFQQLRAQHRGPHGAGPRGTTAPTPTATPKTS